MLAPCSDAPDHIAWTAASVAPATSADASCMPGKTGSSGVPRPKPGGGGRSGSWPAARTAAR